VKLEMKSKNKDINKLKLTKIFSNIMRINQSKVKLNFSQKANKEWDSMNHVRLIIELEKFTKQKISFNTSQKLNTFRLVYNFLKK